MMDLSWQSAFTSFWVLSLASFGFSQRIIVVDANGGGNYKDLPPAVAAAKDGDRIVINKGVYSPAATSKALRIVGRAGAVIRVTQTQPRFDVSGLSKTKVFVMQGIRFDVAPYRPKGLIPAPLRILNCAGQVHLEGLTTRGLAPIAVSFSIDIQNSDAVTLADCQLEPGILVSRSRLVATGCTLTGLDGIFFRAFAGGQGMFADRSTVELAQVVARGGRGQGGHFPAYNAVFARNSKLILRGDKNSVYTGGLQGPSRNFSLYGSNNSSLLIDPSVTLLPARRGFTKVTSRRLPALSGKGGALGGQTSIQLFAERGNGYALFAALPTKPSTIPNLDDLWLDAKTLLFILSGIMPASEHVSTSTFVPRNSAFLGLPVAFQVLQLNPRSVFELSNPLVSIQR